MLIFCDMIHQLFIMKYLKLKWSNLCKPKYFFIIIFIFIILNCTKNALNTINILYITWDICRYFGNCFLLFSFFFEITCYQFVFLIFPCSFNISIFKIFYHFPYSWHRLPHAKFTTTCQRRTKAKARLNVTQLSM